MWFLNVVVFIIGLMSHFRSSSQDIVSHQGILAFWKGIQIKGANGAGFYKEMLQNP